MAPEYLSLITTPVYLLKNGDQVSQGTGFYYIIKDSDKGNALFLITNYHVLAGNSPQKKQKPIGDEIVFYRHIDRNNPGNVKKIKAPLFKKDGTPIWFCSKEYPNADVAVIPFISSPHSYIEVFAISEAHNTDDIKIRPSSIITLIGYPYDFCDRQNWLPIWKTGNIASEPDINFEGKPLFLIDVSAFPGMSGSPVFAIASSTYETVDGLSNIGGSARKFLGIYASNLIRHEAKYLEEIPYNSKKRVLIDKSLEIGHVWKASLISDIIKKINIDEYKSLECFYTFDH